MKKQILNEMPKKHGLMGLISNFGDSLWNRFNIGMRAKLLILFLVVKVLPLILLAAIAWNQFAILGKTLTKTAVDDSTVALNDMAVENIERMTTDAAKSVADFLYESDDNIRIVADLEATQENYTKFIEDNTKAVIPTGDWTLNEDDTKWVQTDPPEIEKVGGKSTNKENDERNGFHYRYPDNFPTKQIPLYDEVTFVDLNGQETVKVVAKDSPKKNYPMNPNLLNISDKNNTYVKAEDYWSKLQNLQPGEIYVSDVIGAYVGSNYIGMYAPEALKTASQDRGYDIPFKPEAQAYAGRENPNGQRFEGIIRWATPVSDSDGNKIGYVTFALNHDHIMEFVDHITPMNERYIQVPSAFEGNYAFIWDYQCRNIAHPRHNSIVGYNPETGDPQTPWLEQSIYDAWQASEEPLDEFLPTVPTFDNQSREKLPAAQLTKEGLVGLDGRYLNNAPQCTGWMDLTAKGGSGSFYILWSGLYKLTTAAAIPYYTGQYAPSEENDFSMRGFAFVAIGAGIDDFTAPASATETQLKKQSDEMLFDTTVQLVITTLIIIALVILIAIWMSGFITDNISKLNVGIDRFKSGERQFRFSAPIKDEFGMLADSFDEMADSIVDSVAGPLAITDMDENIIYMNEAGLSIIHTNLAAVVGHTYHENSIYPYDSEYYPITALIEGREASIYHYEETDSYVRGIANYLLDKDGNNVGYIVITQDVTQLVKIQLELEAAITDANRANAHKGAFLARMSHEIRTPMNAIIGLTDIVQAKLEELHASNADTEEIKLQMEKIQSSSQHLLGLLNDILDISKIESGKIELSSDAFVLPKLINDVKEILTPRFDSKGIKFNIHYDEFEPKTFIGDSLRLRQVLINLLGNAVKFTQEGGTTDFTIEKLEQEDDKTLIRFLIKDNGIGIPADRLDKIFEPFEQESANTSRQYGGTGLGLAISKNIVELFGGDIQIQSTLGDGSEFSFEIWLEVTDIDIVSADALVNTRDKFKGMHGLVVDDVEINRMIVASMLEPTGIEMDEADDGTTALEAFIKSPEGYYDIIFMDVQMPTMDGYEASSAIRALNRKDAQTVPIISLTANAFKDDIEKALASGMNEHVAKPVEMDRLVEVLIKYLG
ncbi:MAG: response regulator [Clostridiales Family XIII bacterium]|jgi:signal transduction histidine kinase/HAMP domain-containing protein|nr:response regulator [Clostridiales Family XIII bacterium]